MFTYDTCPIMLLREIATLFNRKALYLIGAGASISYLNPQYSNFFNDAKKLIEQYSPFSGITLNQDYQLKENEIIKFKISGFPYQINFHHNKYFIDTTEFDFYDYLLCEKLKFETPRVLDVAIALSCSLDQYPIRCYEYQIFNLMNSSSVIANYNHDNLINKFVENKIKIINLHGVVSPEFKKYIMDNLDSLITSNISIFSEKIVLANKEYESDLNKNAEFASFVKELEQNNFDYIVILGYSFFGIGNDILDIVSYEQICQYLSDHPNCRIIIIDPCSRKLPDFFSSKLKLKNIRLFNIEWDSFTFAFFKTHQFKANNKIFKFSAIDLNRFIYFYSIYSRNREIFKKYNNSISEECMDENNRLIRLCGHKNIYW